MTRRYAVLPTVLMDPSLCRRLGRADHRYADPPRMPRPVRRRMPSSHCGRSRSTSRRPSTGPSSAGVSGGTDAGQPGQTGRQLWAVRPSRRGLWLQGRRRPAELLRAPAHRQPAPRAVRRAHAPLRLGQSGAAGRHAGHRQAGRSGCLDRAVSSRRWTSRYRPESAVVIRQHAPDALNALVTLKGRLADKASGLPRPTDRQRPCRRTRARAEAFRRPPGKIKLGNAYKIETVPAVSGRRHPGAAPKPPGRAAAAPVRQPVNRPYVTGRGRIAGPAWLPRSRSASPMSPTSSATWPGILNVGPDGNTPVTVTYTPTGHDRPAGRERFADDPRRQARHHPRAARAGADRQSGGRAGRTGTVRTRCAAQCARGPLSLPGGHDARGRRARARRVGTATGAGPCRTRRACSIPPSLR